MEKDNEIKLLKEMVKSIKTMIRVKDSDINRYKSKLNQIPTINKYTIN